MKKKSWYHIDLVAAASGSGKTASVSLHDVIGSWGISVKDFASELKSLGDVERIDLSIHSPGGVVTDGWAIYNILKAHPAPVHARVEGLAASMASVILMAADHIEMPANAYIMIHRPHVAGYESDDLREIIEDTAEELGGLADLLDKMEGNIVSAYAARTGNEEQDIADLMAKTTWLDGNEAKELGFVDVVLADQKAAACAAGWADYLELPPAVEIAAAPEKPGILARLLGKDTAQPEAGATESDALRAQLATARADITALELERDLQRRRADEATAECVKLAAEIAGHIAARADFDRKLSDGVAARIAELGIPEGKLPPAAEGDLGEEETIESLIQQLAAETDATKRYELAGKLSALRKKPRV